MVYMGLFYCCGVLLGLILRKKYCFHYVSDPTPFLFFMLHNSSHPGSIFDIKDLIDG